MSAMPNHATGRESKEAAVKTLADAHRALDPSIERIFRLEAPGRESDPREPIKLLEVNPNTTASGLMPVHFGSDPTKGILYPTVIVEIHPSEWALVQQGLPHGWKLGAAI